jgi:hypothetical protein
MSRFAEATDVSVEKSRAEIERLLVRYGADQFMSGWRDKAAVVAFRAQGRHLRFLLPLPSKDDPEFKKRGAPNQYQPGGVPTQEQQMRRWEQACRQRWRALCLCIKAKLEAVETGISTFESEFLANIVLPNGQTMAEHAAPLIARAYETGQMPPLLQHFTD